MPTDSLADETAVLTLDAGIALVHAAEDSGDWKAVADWLASHPEHAAGLANFLAAQRGLRSAAAPLRAATERAGAMLGEFALIEEIGRGGMGVVFRARDVKLNRGVAVKLLRADGTFSAVESARFRYEAEMVASLDHPNIVQVFGFGETDSGPYLVMPLMAGSLAAWLKNRGNRKLDPKAAAGIVRAVALGVHHAHQRGLIHRDLKPGNILLDADGVSHVADFGLARHIDATTTGGIAGTAAYMAPEQARGEKQLTTAVDVYALGVILFELLTGKIPYADTDVPGILLRLTDEHEPVPLVHSACPDVPSDLAAICAKCLEKRPDDRYRSAQELASDLDNFIDGRAVSAQPPGFWDWLRQLSRIRPPDSYATPFWPVTAWFGVLLFLINFTIYGLARYDAPSAWVAVTNFTGAFLQFAVLWWYMLRRFRQVPLIDRHSLILAAGCISLYVPLTVAYAPLSLSASAREGLGVYPAFAGITGLALFTLGSTNWSRFFPIGLGVMGLIPFLARWPNEAPLLYGTSLASVMWYWTYFSANVFHRRSVSRSTA